jgi:hypothetical protein
VSEDVKFFVNVSLIIALFLVWRIIDLEDIAQPVNRDTNKFKINAELEDVRCAAYYYFQANGHLPTMTSNAAFTKDVMSGNELLKSYPWELNAKQELVDPWGNPLKIFSPSKGNILIQSAGPDKIFGTADDPIDCSQVTGKGTSYRHY